MKNLKQFIFPAILIVVAITAIVVSRMKASTDNAAKASVTTSQSDQPGQVVVKNDNGATYLTTEINQQNSTTTPNQSTTTTSTNQTNTNGAVTTTTTTSTTVTTDEVATPEGKVALTRTPILLPRGFADNFSQLVNSLLSIVLVVAALLVLFALLSGAFDWITSGGDKGKIDRARQKMISAVIGIIIVASAFAILTLVVRVLGFTSINDVINNIKPIGSGQTVIENGTVVSTSSGTVLQ